MTETGKEADGDITAMGGPWGTASKAEAIRAINNGWIRYYVQDHQGQQASVEVVAAPTGTYLRTDPNAACDDNLDSLPDF